MYNHRQRREARRRDKKATFMISSSKVFNELILGDKDYIVVGEGSRWWEDNQKYLKKGSKMIIKYADHKKYKFICEFDSWEYSHNPLDQDPSRKGKIIAIKIRKIVVAPYTTEYVRKSLRGGVEAFEKKKEEIILKAKIRKAFKSKE